MSNAERAKTAVTSDLRRCYAKCIAMIEQGDCDAAAKASADALHHVNAFSGWYLRRRRAR